MKCGVVNSNGAPTVFVGDGTSCTSTKVSNHQSCILKDGVGVVVHEEWKSKILSHPTLGEFYLI